MVAVGLVFELPVVILLLSIFGIVTPKVPVEELSLCGPADGGRGCCGIVPSNDMASIFVVWIPLVGLYFLSIGLSWLVYLRKNKKKEMPRTDASKQDSAPDLGLVGKRPSAGARRWCGRHAC